MLSWIGKGVINLRKMILGLCEGRHDLPSEVEGYIFGKELTLDFDSLEDICCDKLLECNELILYVTGFTPALTTVISFCVHNSIPLTLMHYNRDTNEYVKQIMWVVGYSRIEIG